MIIEKPLTDSKFIIFCNIIYNKTCYPLNKKTPPKLNKFADVKTFPIISFQKAFYNGLKQLM